MLARLLSAVALFAAVWPADGRAAALSVTPITITRTAPAAAAALTLTNHGDGPLNVQIRIFHWRQQDGADVLEATRDAVVSPPIVKMVPGTDYTIRVVRVAATPVAGEETYRVLVDELPSGTPLANGNVRFLLRQSIPAFFVAAAAKPALVDWSVKRSGDELVVRGANRGGLHLKVTQLALGARGGKPAMLVAGLAGYILAGSAKTWTVKAPAGVPQTGAAVLAFDSDRGHTDVPIAIGQAP